MQQRDKRSTLLHCRRNLNIPLQIIPNFPIDKFRTRCYNLLEIEQRNGSCMNGAQFSAEFFRKGALASSPAEMMRERIEPMNLIRIMPA